MAKGLSRMRGNSHVRFLGGWKVVTSSGYPVPEAWAFGCNRAKTVRRTRALVVSRACTTP